MRELQARLLKFFDEHIYPSEKVYENEVAQNRRNGDAFVATKIIEELKVKARAAGLWNLFLPHSPRAPEGLSNLEYAPLCEIMGRVPWAPKCSTAPRRTRATWRPSSATAPRSIKTGGWNRCSKARFARRSS